MARSSSVFSKLGQLLLAASLAVLAMPVAALAADPPTTPAPIRQEGFESALPAVWSLSLLAISPTPKAYWGRMANIHRTGTWSLWCAGHQFNTSQVPIIPAVWGNYLQQTLGRAVLDASQLDDYYYSELEFYYNMPTLGASDGSSFSTGWTDGTNPGTDHHTTYAKTATSGWVPVNYVLADADNNFNMSRSGGDIYFNFFDLVEGPYAYNFLTGEVYSNPVRTGRGPSIDDLTIRGYKYGPVRNLAAVGTDSEVTLSWDKPYEAVGSTTVDSRSIEYRVWRAVNGANPLVWTDLTGSSRLSSTGYVDSAGTAGVTYRYLVQAWDPATGTGYGQDMQVTGRKLAGEMDAWIDAQTAVLKGDTLDMTYHVKNTGGVALTDIALVDNWSGSSAIPLISGLAADAQVDVPRTTPALTANTTVHLVATASGGAPQAIDDLDITVYDPKIQVTVSPSVTEVVEDVEFSAAYTIKNTGNAPLKNIVLTNGLGGDQLGIVGSLAAGASTTLYRDVSLPSSGKVNAYVMADYSIPPNLDGSVNAAGSSTYITVYSNTPPARIAGTTRITTAVDISKEAFPGGLGGDKTVVLANSDAWADALPASALAGAVRGPLMLSGTTSVSGYVMNELTRLGAEKVYLVGGESVLSPAVKTQLINAGYTVARLGGNTRYDTAELISAEVNKLVGRNSGGTVFLVTGVDFPDALSASSLAANLAAPILLTKQDAIPSATDRALRNLQPDRVVVCGGTSVVSDAVLSSLYVDKYGKPSPVRKAGADRYATAQIVNQYGSDTLVQTDPEGVFVATGTNYPDALAGGVIAGAGAARWRPLMLTKPTTLSSATKSFISANKSIQFYSILGGTSAVSSAVETQLKAAVAAN